MANRLNKPGNPSSIRTRRSNRSEKESNAPQADPAATSVPDPNIALPRGKLGALIELLRRPQGASIGAMMATTGWQAHSVRGALAGALKKKRGLIVISEKTEEGRRYRIDETRSGVDA